MSADVWLVINTGVEEVKVCDVGNYTHNVQDMWCLALNGAAYRAADVAHPFWQLVELRLCAMDGLNAKEAIPLLERAVAHMYAPEHRSAYVALNPDNGWGNFEGAREFLEKLLKACREHPACTIRTDC